jgi:hypothetical protein
MSLFFRSGEVFHSAATGPSSWGCHAISPGKPGTGPEKLWVSSKVSLFLKRRRWFGDIWGWVKTLVPSEPHPTKNVSIGIDPYPYIYIFIYNILIKNLMIIYSDWLIRFYKYFMYPHPPRDAPRSRHLPFWNRAYRLTILSRTNWGAITAIGIFPYFSYIFLWGKGVHGVLIFR